MALPPNANIEAYLQSLTGGEIDDLRKHNEELANHVARDRLRYPRTEVRIIAVYKFRRKYKIHVMKTIKDAGQELFFPLVGDAVLPQINFRWVNDVEELEIANGRNISNLWLLIRNVRSHSLGFYWKTNVTADQALRMMPYVTRLIYKCGVAAREEGIITRNTLKTITEKSLLGPGIRRIDLCNKKSDGKVYAQDLFKFVTESKFEEPNPNRCSPYVRIKHISDTLEQFEKLFGNMVLSKKTENFNTEIRLKVGGKVIRLAGTFEQLPDDPF